jgi:hypothetical protein
MRERLERVRGWSNKPMQPSARMQFIVSRHCRSRRLIFTVVRLLEQSARSGLWYVNERESRMGPSEGRRKH